MRFLRTSISAPASWVVAMVLLLTLSVDSASASASNQRYSAHYAAAVTNSAKKQQHSCNSDALFIRGGSSSKANTNPEKYRMEQILLLQSRSARLREALTNRGVLQDYTALDAPTTPQPVDWDCALSTPKSPKSCLYSFDAEPFTKVVAPMDTNQWITLGALNRLRRTDPSKVEPMWHSKYAIFDSWFRAGKSPYSMYAHLPWQGYMLSLLLDGPFVLNCALLAVLAFVFSLTRPLWESMLTLVLTSQFLWIRWPNWGRFVHAALPFKLLLGQMAWKGMTKLFFRIQGVAREYLIQVESRIWEEAIPLTVVETTEAGELPVFDNDDETDSGSDSDW